MKKLIRRDSTDSFSLISLIIGVLIILVGFACTPNENELGRDILPPGDNIFVFYDTLDAITSYPTEGKPFKTSESILSPQSDRLFILGNVMDTLSGFTHADIVTQFNTTSGFTYGPNMVVDSCVLSLYFTSTDAYDVTSSTVKIYELTERIYMDSVYYTDYDITGKYNPVPLAEKVILTADSALIDFKIDDQEFINKFINPPSDTLFENDSLFKDYFNGFYITTETFTSGGMISKVHLAKSTSRLSLKYANDSTAVDTIPGYNYKWSNFLINEYTTQKLNLISHDYSGTSFESMIGNPDAHSQVLFVQGMNGVNTTLHLNDIEKWRDSGIIAINNAYLEFEVIPDSISGINIEDVPNRLILLTDMGDYVDRMYDFVVDADKFDGYLRPVSKGVFYDTTYVYRFNIGLHYQSLINGDVENYDLVLQPFDWKNFNFVKLWSNYYAKKGSLRLKIIYTKIE